jgi:predicted nucleotide-binding protein
MDDLIQSLSELSVRFDAVAARIDRPEVHQSFQSLETAISDAAEAFSGSWFGYHSRVYYRNLEPPPPGAHFSPEWGLMNLRAIQDTRGDWVEYTYKDVYEHLKGQTTGLGLDELIELANSVGETLGKLREDLISILSAVADGAHDSYLQNLVDRSRDTRLLGVPAIVETLAPHGQFFSRDMTAVTSGIQTPPHVYLLAQVRAVRLRLDVAKSLGRLSSQAASHLGRRRSARRDRTVQGSRVFLGHGRSAAWKDLKDFIQDRLGLDWDEFNRVPVAGITNIARLSEMLENAGIAFLVMTAEDEQKDGKLHARMNVVHEAGLFQGRLGFTKAIVVLEEGCEEFSNIQGLGQLRFPAGRISAIFEDVRQVLERERMLDETYPSHSPEPAAGPGSSG